jgi:hypothetical protein
MDTGSNPTSNKKVINSIEAIVKIWNLEIELTENATTCVLRVSDLNLVDLE